MLFVYMFQIKYQHKSSYVSRATYIRPKNILLVEPYMLEFNYHIQRCQVHVAKNVLAKVPRKLKGAVADDMRSIFYACSKQKALALFKSFKQQ